MDECTSGATGRSLKGSSDVRIERDIFLLEEVEVRGKYRVGNMINVDTFLLTSCIVTRRA